MYLPTYISVHIWINDKSFTGINDLKAHGMKFNKVPSQTNYDLWVFSVVQRRQKFVLPSLDN